MEGRCPQRPWTAGTLSPIFSPTVHENLLKARCSLGRDPMAGSFCRTFNKLPKLLIVTARMGVYSALADHVALQAGDQGTGGKYDGN
jgi:hypothetical protein